MTQSTPSPPSTRRHRPDRAGYPHLARSARGRIALVLLAVWLSACWHHVAPIPASQLAPASKVARGAGTSPETRRNVPSSLPIQTLELAGRTLQGPRRVAELPFWEGPRADGLDLARTGDVVVLTSNRGPTAWVAELRGAGDGLSVRKRLWRGELGTAASDAAGRVVVHGRPASASQAPGEGAVGQLLLADLNANASLRPLELPQVPGWGWNTMLCGSAGSVTAWTRQAPRYLPVQTLPGPPRALPFSAAVVRPLACAYGARSACSSLLHQSDQLETWLLDRRCGDHAVTQEVAAPRAQVRLHPDGTLADYERGTDASTLRVRPWDGEPTELTFPSSVYAVTFWDRRTLLVHLSRADAKREVHLQIVAVDIDNRSQIEIPADPFRGLTFTRPIPDDLPAQGNGLPLAFALGGKLVLVAGDGSLWVWA